MGLLHAIGGEVAGVIAPIVPLIRVGDPGEAIECQTCGGARAGYAAVVGQAGVDQTTRRRQPGDLAGAAG